MGIREVFTLGAPQPAPPELQTYEALRDEIVEAHERGHLYGIMSALTHFFYAPGEEIRSTPAGNSALYDLLTTLGYEARPVNDDFEHDYPQERDLYLIGLAISDFRHGNPPGPDALGRMTLTVQGVHPSHWPERLNGQGFSRRPAVS
jgi:hypothetical protein